MKKEFIKGLVHGLGFCITVLIFTIAVSLFVYFSEQNTNNTVSEYEEIDKFKLHNYTYRVVENNPYDNGLHIAGEIELLSKGYRYYELQAVLRDDKEHFVAECADRLTGYGLGIAYKFEIECSKISNLNQFHDIKFILNGFK